MAQNVTISIVNAFFLFVLTAFRLFAQDPFLPPAKFKSEWTALEKKGFYDWKKIKFVSSGGVADGGTVAYIFRVQDGSKFSVLVANPHYWTEEDKVKKRQVIYITKNGRYYLLESQSKQEKHLLKVIQELEIDPKDEKGTKELLNKLCDTIKTRKSEWLYP